jgi:hypothetical protein
MKPIFTPVAVLAFFTLLFGDKIYTQDGGFVEGVIVRETDSAMVLKVAIGEMDVQKSEIVRVEKGKKNEQAAMEEKWRERKTGGVRPAAGLKAKRIQVGNNLKAGVMLFCDAEKTADLENCNLPEETLKDIPAKARIAIYFPKGFTAEKKWPLFLAMSPDQGNNSQAIYSYAGFADEEGFIIAAPELPAPGDTDEARYYYSLYAITLLNNQGFTQNQPVWIGGFSGGAKWALQLGGFGGDVFSGILAMGCNEDYATLGLNEYKNKSALEVPIYLLNGTEDQIAGTNRADYSEMISSLKNSGFKRVIVQTYPGSHALPSREAMEAFDYLKRQK